jgi:hypothetical protein
MSGGYQNSQTFFVGALSTNGAQMQMGACGIMTALLTATPSLTFWRFRYLQHTAFALLSVMQSFDGSVAFGETATCKVIKAGDLLYFLYAVLQVPGIRACPTRGGGCGPTQNFPYALDPSNPNGMYDAEYFATLNGGAQSWLFDNYGSCGDYEQESAGCAGGVGACDEEPWVHWANAIGQLIIRKVTLIVGTQMVDTLYSDYLFMWEELAGKPGKRLTEMIGKRYCREDLIADSQQTRTLYVPLPFYFTQTPGNALPLCAIMFSGAQLIVEFEELRKCVVVSSPDIQVVLCNGGGPLTANVLKAAIDGTQIFLDDAERDRFGGGGEFDQIIVQVTPLYTGNNSGQQVRLNLGFSNPVLELIWAIRRKCSEKYNNWFNYSGILGREPMVSAEINFNSTARQQKREAGFYRMQQPYQHHSLLPEACIYCYCFALYPEEAQPSGAANFSRLEQVQLLIDLQDGLQGEDISIILFCRSLNMIKFEEGSATAAFA